MKTPNRRHYVVWLARLTPVKFHRWINRLRGRPIADTFPTKYRRPDGNAPLGIWGSLLYNRGWGKGVIFAGLWGAVLQWFTVNVVRSSFSLPVAIAGQLMLVRLALVADPYTLLLEGVVTLGIVGSILRRLDPQELALKRATLGPALCPAPVNG